MLREIVVVALCVQLCAPQPHKIMCEKYSELVFEEVTTDNGTEKIDHCGLTRQKRIIGGEVTQLRNLPHMVQVGVSIHPPDINWICGGTLISEYFIMSSAGCDPPSYVKWVRLGYVDGEETESTSVIRKIIKTYQHPDYDRLHLYYNVVLLRVKDKIVFTPLIRPVCLYSREELPDEGIITGWGVTTNADGSQPAGVLHQTTVDILPTEKCSASFQNTTRGLPNGFLDTIQFCALGNNSEDSCRGDEGGPLQVRMTDIDCMYEQVGIINRIPKPTCGSGPGLYTRVSAFVPWIESIVWTDKDIPVEADELSTTEESSTTDA